MQTAADLVLEYNCPVAQIEAQVRANSRRSLPWLAMAEPHKGHAVIVGGGPSLARHLDEIAWRASIDQTVFAVNGVARHIEGNGIAPHYHVLLDAREHNAAFVGPPNTRTRYIVASQCHDAVFDRLAGRDVTMFHAHTDNVEDWLPRERPPYTLIASGSTVLLAAMCIAYAKGFRKIHLYGADSSFEEAHHAYAQPQNDADDVIYATVAGRTFKTTPWMAAQVEQFQRVARELADGDALITVHGDGLLPTVARAMMLSDAHLEAIKYRSMWDHDAYRCMSPAEAHADWIESNLPQPPARVLDFGCGTGRFTSRLRRKGFDAIGVDFAGNCLDADVDVPLVEACLWDLPSDLKGDAGVCCDVMEHIPPERVGLVLNAIARAVPKCVFTIAHHPDEMGALIGQPLHLTVREAEWWAAELLKQWRYVHMLGDGRFIAEQTYADARDVVPGQGK